MVSITVQVEHFNSGPATELQKLNKFADGIEELQAALQDLQNAPPPTVNVTFVQMMTFINGEIKKVNVGTDGNLPIDP